MNSHLNFETVSLKRDRIYKRKFDHEEAQRLHMEGMSYVKIAERFDVSAQAVRRVCDPKVAAEMAAKTNQWMKDNWRKPCRGKCGRLIYMHPGTNRSGYCVQCFTDLRAASRTDVGTTTLRCSKCGNWKPDADFPTHHAPKGRRGRNNQCRACATATRQAHRASHPELQRAADRRSALKKGRKMQTYVVLSPTNGDNDYKEILRIEAVNPTHAIEQAATTSGRYVAVPASRFTIMEVEPVQAFKVIKTAVGE